MSSSSPFQAFVRCSALRDCNLYAFSSLSISIILLISRLRHFKSFCSIRVESISLLKLKQRQFPRRKITLTYVLFINLVLSRNNLNCTLLFGSSAATTGARDFEKKTYVEIHLFFRVLLTLVICLPYMVHE